MMKRHLLLVLITLLWSALGLGAQTTWKGEAGLAERGSLPEGYFAASNEFPRNTMLVVENVKTKSAVKVRVLKRMESALDSRFVLLSTKAAGDLGIGGPESLLVSVKVDSSLEGLRSSLMEDRSENPDPEVNPGSTGTVAVANTSQPDINPGKTDTLPIKTDILEVKPDTVAVKPDTSPAGVHPTSNQGNTVAQVLPTNVPDFSKPSTGPGMTLPPNRDIVASLPTNMPSIPTSDPGRTGPAGFIPSTSSVPLTLLPNLATSVEKEKPWVGPRFYLPAIGALTALILPERIDLEPRPWYSTPVALPQVQSAALSMMLYPNFQESLEEGVTRVGPRFYLPALGTLTALLVPERLKVDETPWASSAVAFPEVKDTAVAMVLFPDPSGALVDNTPDQVSNPVAPMDTGAWVALVMPQIHAFDAADGSLALAPKGYDPRASESIDDFSGKLAYLPPREGPLFNPDIPGVSGPAALALINKFPLMSPGIIDSPSVISGAVALGVENKLPLLTPGLVEGPYGISTAVTLGSRDSWVASLTLPTIPERFSGQGPELSPPVHVAVSGTERPVSNPVKPTLADITHVKPDTIKPDTIKPDTIKPDTTKPTVVTALQGKPVPPLAPGTYAPVASALKGELLGSLPVLTAYQAQGDYIELASFKDEKSLLKALDKVKSHIPLALLVKEGNYRLVAGPVKRDQTGFLLNHYQTQGFKQALVVKGLK